MIYFCLFTLLVILQVMFCVLENRSGNTVVYKPSKQIYFLISGILILMAGLRKGIGYDFWSYKNLYNILHNTNLPISILAHRLNYEMGYVWLNKVIPTFSLLIFLVAVLSVGVKIYYIYYFSDVPILVLLLFFSSVFLTFDMGVIRQGITIAMYWVIIELIARNKKTLAIVLILISSLFHVTSLTFLLILLLGEKRFSKKIIYVSAIGAVILYFLNLGELLVNVFSRFGLDIITTKITYYYEAGLEKTSFVSLVKRIVVLIFFTKIGGDFWDNKRERIYYNSYYFSVLLMSIFSSIEILGGRGVAALYSTQLFLWGILYYKEKNNLLRIIILLVCILLAMDSMYGTISYGNLSGQVYSPYRGIWQ